MHSRAITLYLTAVSAWPTHRSWDRESARYRDADRLLSLHPEMLVRSIPERWVSSLHSYETFWHQTGRRPRERTRNMVNLEDAERRLGEWARYQRRVRNRLTRYQTLRLEASPAFVWDPQAASWEANLQACARHKRVTGSLPRLNSGAPEEYRLARWLGRQLSDLRNGKVRTDRREAITRLLES